MPKKKKTTPQTLKSICCCYCFCCSFCCPLSNRVLFIMFVIWACTYDIILNSQFRFFSERWLALNGHQQLSTFSIFMKLFKATHTNTETERYLYKKWTVGVECSLSLPLFYFVSVLSGQLCTWCLHKLGKHLLVKSSGERKVKQKRD